MSIIVVGLGNPGEQYERTRHNAGRIILDSLVAEFGDEPEFNKKINAFVSAGKIKKEKVVFVAPMTFMNLSGKAVVSLVKTVKAAEKLVVIYDDFNLPIGRMKISFNRSSGGHNGLESIMKAVKTEAFVRFRIGTAPANAKGEAKVPHGEEKIEKFILGPFKDEEMKVLKKIAGKAKEALEVFAVDGREKAMSIYNAQ